MEWWMSNGVSNTERCITTCTNISIPATLALVARSRCFAVNRAPIRQVRSRVIAAIFALYFFCSRTRIAANDCDRARITYNRVRITAIKRESLAKERELMRIQEKSLAIEREIYQYQSRLSANSCEFTNTTTAIKCELSLTYCNLYGPQIWWANW